MYERIGKPPFNAIFTISPQPSSSFPEMSRLLCIYMLFRFYLNLLLKCPLIQNDLLNCLNYSCHKRLLRLFLGQVSGAEHLCPGGGARVSVLRGPSTMAQTLQVQRAHDQWDYCQAGFADPILLW